MDHHMLCEHGVDSPQCPAACDDHKYHGVHTAEEVIFWLTIAILSIFMAENPLRHVLCGT